VKFSPVKEIASKKCKCRFSKFFSAGVQKKCRKCRFFRLRGIFAATGLPGYIRNDAEFQPIEQRLKLVNGLKNYVSAAYLLSAKNAIRKCTVANFSSDDRTLTSTIVTATKAACPLQNTHDRRFENEKKQS